MTDLTTTMRTPSAARAGVSRVAIKMVISLLVAALSTVPSALSAQPARPISIGGSADEDACAAVGKVKGLKPKGTLAVRTGPGRSFASVDELRNGQLLYVRDSSKDGTAGRRLRTWQRQLRRDQSCCEKASL